MPTPNRPASQNKHPEQYMNNASFDEDYGVNAVEILGEDTGTNVLRRVKVTADGKLDVNSSVLPTGAATSAKQDSQITLQTQLESLVETLQELVQRLAPLAGAMSNTAALRVAPVSSVSTAVTGPITSAQSIAEKAAAGVLYPEKVAITNLTAIQSNINNAVAA